DGLQDLSLGSQNGVFGLGDVAVDHGGERRIFLLLEPARTLEFRLAFDDPGIGCLPTVECFSFTMDNSAAFFNDDLRGKSLGAVFASPSNDRAHVVSRSNRYEIRQKSTTPSYHD